MQQLFGKIRAFSPLNVVLTNLLTLVSCNPGGASPPVSASCSGDGQSNSAMMIDSGQLISVRSPNKVGGVLYSETRVDATHAEACTATAVSTSTVLTAAHCLFEPAIPGQQSGDVKNAYGKVVNKTFCVSDFALKRICSDNVYVDRAYADPNGDPQKGLDYGFVVFPPGTFKEYFAYARDEVQVGDSIVLVGFSPRNISDTSQGSKRFGWNEISAIDDFNLVNKPLIYSEYKSNFDGVAVDKGDSGGPLLTGACKIAGIASLRGIMVGQPDGSYHTNLTGSTVSNALYKLWLANGRDGYICGLSGMETSACPEIGRNQPTESPPLTSGDKFPCEAHNLPQSAEPAVANTCPAN